MNQIKQIKQIGPAVKRQVPLENIENDDQILYTVWTKGGGIDGLSTEKPYMKFASFNKNEANRKVTNWDELKLIALTKEQIKDIKRSALEKLDAIDKCILDLN